MTVLLSLFFTLAFGLAAALVAAVATAQPVVFPAFVLAAILLGMLLVFTKRSGLRRMPSNPQVMLPLILFLALPAMAFAQGTQTETAGILTTLIPALVTVFVPLLIALTKKWLPSLPKWLLPILAPLLGVGLALIGDVAVGQNVGVIMGAVYGGLGTWLRELIDQLKKASE
jgi:drug/metabolite transporter (DMT)-like permease